MNPSLRPLLETSCFKGSWKKNPYSDRARTVKRRWNLQLADPLEKLEVHFAFDAFEDGRHQPVMEIRLLV